MEKGCEKVGTVFFECFAEHGARIKGEVSTSFLRYLALQMSRWVMVVTELYNRDAVQSNRLARGGTTLPRTHRSFARGPHTTHGIFRSQDGNAKG